MARKKSKTERAVYVTIGIPSEWKQQVIKLAAEKTLQHGHEIKYLDLLRDYIYKGLETELGKEENTDGI